MIRYNRAVATYLRDMGLRRSLRPSLVAGYLARHITVLCLVSLALLTRLPLLSSSIDEVDAANFINALTAGYNVSLLRPHPPGYPVYVFMGWLLDGFLDNPRLSLSLLSALLGSLAVIPFYSLLKQFTDGKIALFGSVLFVFNPLFWSFSEAALSDVPSMFFALVMAWLCFTARKSNSAFLWACVIGSLAIGVRQPNVSLLLMLGVPIGYRWLVSKERSWKLVGRGIELFFITTVVWVLLMILFGTDGISDYLQVTTRQWETAVRVYDFRQVDSPWWLNLPLRVERFFSGYFLTYLWTGDDAKTPLTLLMVIPWVFGFALFITGFSFRSPKHILIGSWVVGIGYTILAIHFLPRYGLSQMPGFMIACLMGYQFLGAKLLRHPRRLEILSIVGIGCMMILYGIKYQSPVNTFEFTPPEGSFYAGAVFTCGILFVLLASFLYRRPNTSAATASVVDSRASQWRKVMDNYPKLLPLGLALLAIPFAIKGYSLVSIAHDNPNPGQQLVEHVRENFDTTQITPCWDNQTHSFYEAIIPDVIPTGYWSVDDLYTAHQAGRILLVTDRCVWFEDLSETIGLTEVGHFTGASPLWSKTPSIRLYTTGTPP